MVTLSGGNRSASACTKNWIPPGLGGKSLVRTRTLGNAQHSRIAARTHAGPRPAPTATVKILKYLPTQSAVGNRPCEVPARSQHRRLPCHLGLGARPPPG